jgi:TP901 family phage tail tape measure protein
MALKTSNLKIIIAGDAAGAVRAFRNVKKEAEMASSGASNAFNKSTSRIGGAFSRLGGTMQSWGIPFGQTLTDLGTKLDSVEGKGSKFSSVMSDVGKAALQASAVGIAGVGYESVKLGMGFQTAMTQLVTGAGEAKSSIGKVSQGVLDMASTVGQTPTALAQSLYTIESAGYHGAAGLSILKSAAEGASTGNAQMGTVADATTTILNAYGKAAGNSTSVVNELIATERSGKSHLEDIAGALSAVVPIAANAGLSYAQVGGALATMTGMGMSAQQGTQDLANTIRSLQNPNAVAVNEMQQLGINSNQVSKNLGKNGLTGTLAYLSQSILKNMGPSGMVMLKAFNQSKAAGQDLQTMLSSMSPQMKNLAQEFMSGKLTMSQWRKSLPTNMQGVMGQFTSLYAKTQGFNQQLKSGLPATQTYEAALSKVTGGATGLNTALMLTGSHASTFSANVAAIGSAAHDSKGNVQGFGDVQKNLAFQIAQAKDGVIALGTKLGLILIPMIQRGIKVVSQIVGWFSKHTLVAKILGGVIAGVLVTAIGIYIAGVVRAGVQSVITFGKMGIAAGAWAKKMSTASGRAQLAEQRLARELEKTKVKVDDSSKGIVKSKEDELKATENTSNQVQASTDEEIAANERATASVQTSAEEQNAAMESVQVTEEAAAATAESTGIAIDGALGPIGIAIGVVSAAIGFLGPHWKTIWKDIKRVISVAWSWISNHLVLISAAFGPVGIVIYQLGHHWKTIWKDIKNAVHDAWTFMKPIIDKISGAISGVSKVISGVGGFFSSLFGGGGSKSSGSAGIASKNIPHMANGGLVTKPTLAVVGEAGAELVVPLTKAGNMSLAQPPALPRSISGMAGSGSSSANALSVSPVYNVSVSGTSEQIVAKLQQMLNQHTRDLATMVGAQ